MNTLAKPQFSNLPHGESAGAPILLDLWNRFDFSFLLAQSGIIKSSGAPTWMLSFLYVIGLVARCASVSKMAGMVALDTLLKIMFQGKNLTQYTLSRFLTSAYNWSHFGRKRIQRLQDDQDTRLQEGDVLALDDSLVTHPYGKQLPFLSWLFDHSLKINVWGMNLVALHSILRNGLEYPLFYRIWRKPETNGEGLTKFDLACDMLTQLRESVQCRLWVAMDRWYLKKEFFNFLTEHSFDWVTKAKRNTALYRKEIESWSGRERYVPLNARMLIKEVFARLKVQGTGLVSVSIPNIYIKLPYQTTGKRGKTVKKYRYTPIAAVAAMRLKEDIETVEKEALLEGEKEEDQAATYRGAYLIISNRFDAPQEALKVYTKRWRIEVFFRNAKQELGLNDCHSTTEIHHHAHIELLFVAETLVNYAQWYENKEKTSDEEGITHGKMVNCLFHTRCEIKLKTRRGSQQVYVYIDTEVRNFARLFDAFWPEEIRMFLGKGFSKSQIFPLSA